jgi:hypothetical protein
VTEIVDDKDIAENTLPWRLDVSIPADDILTHHAPKRMPPAKRDLVLIPI